MDLEAAQKAGAPSPASSDSKPTQESWKLLLTLKPNFVKRADCPRKSPGGGSWGPALTFFNFFYLFIYCLHRVKAETLGAQKEVPVNKCKRINRSASSLTPPLCYPSFSATL